MWGKNVQNRIGKIGILSFNIQHQGHGFSDFFLIR